eukprot:TRINITY_DN1554_c0_g1_i2.p1 TRINITY_DN1554_c0_g1~~TRINITY_DN1554_c0_g1_i2.p1  ORF type:complete len:285 (-),score=51.83 TRINITY_DN1554_c0_g1_i2:73-927(-)
MDIYNSYFSKLASEPIVIPSNRAKDLTNNIHLPTLDTFIHVQTYIWNTLCNEWFPKFVSDVGKNINKRVMKVLMSTMTKFDEKTMRLINEFIGIYKVEYPNDFRFIPNIMPTDEISVRLRDEMNNLPVIDDLWEDDEMMLSFREYLYRNVSNDILSFFMEALNYKAMTKPQDLDMLGSYIYSCFIDEQNEFSRISMDPQTFETINRARERNGFTPEIYDGMIEKAKILLRDKWFPEFVISEVYRKCRCEELEYLFSGGRDRSRTMVNYQLYVERMREEGYHEFV